MTITQFDFPTTILYGPGAVGELARRLAESHRDDPLLLVTDPGLVDVGMVREIMDHLPTWGLSVTEFSDVHGNPTEIDILSGVNAYRSIGARAIIALGGGSPMDTAKAIAVLATHEGPLSRFDSRRQGQRQITAPLPPIYAIPTTAGSGSEVAYSAVIVAADTGTKIAISHPQLMPRIATLDAELCVGLPPRLTANTGMDAMTRGLEAYLSGRFHPMADALAIGSVEMAIEHLPRAVASGNNLDARGNMLLCASMAATASRKGLGMIRAMAHPLATHYGMHQGQALAALAPIALRYQLEYKGAHITEDLYTRYTRVAQLLGAETGEGLPDALAGFITGLGIEYNLVELGLTEDDIQILAREAFADSSHEHHPFALSRADFAAAFRACL